MNAIDISNLVSGIVGALIGALATYGAVRLQIISSAKERLRVLLLLNGHTIYYSDPDKEKASFYTDTIASNLAEAHSLYFTVRQGVFCCKRSRLDTAWNKYCGAEFRKDIPGNEPGRLFQRGSHTRDSALSIITEFVDAIHR